MLLEEVPLPSKILLGQRAPTGAVIKFLSLQLAASNNVLWQRQVA
ncbi:hypothetical protein [cyanobacterium endosymbiont of Epithemia turgida]|nr:hypothetical protein [cyanobacterium endosymbiont of Epithemia turgida]